ncbi:MAG: hypothetical protein SFX73_33215 [Kofleriaceae bacterium]|nr:hypothetical protein [Kofleriaceae bacterium]
MRARDWLQIPALVVVAIGGLLFGGHTSYIALRNLTPTELTCAAYLADPSAVDWVHLRECEPGFEQIATVRRGPATTGRGAVTDVYIPLRPRGEPHQPARLLLHVTDGPLLQLGGYASPDVAAELDRSLHRVDGLVERFRSARYRDQIRDTGLSLDATFVVIAHGDRPTPLWLALGVTACGLGAAGLLVRRYLRYRRQPRPDDSLPRAKARMVAE